MPVSDDSLDPRTEERQALASVVPEGSPLDAYLGWAAGRHGPLLYHLVCAITLATHELSRKGFHLHRRQYPMAVWFALIGESASGKSIALDLVERFSHAMWEAAAVQLDPWIEIEGTISGLVGALQPHFNPTRGTTTGILYQHEMSAILQTREPIAELLCKISDGRTYHRHLKSIQDRQRSKRRNDDDDDREPDKIVEPVVSGLFASTEESLAAHFKSFHRQGGLFSRIWWVKPHLAGTSFRMDNDYIGAAQDDDRADAAIDAWVGWLAGLDLLGGEGHEIGITAEAHEVLRTGLFEDARVEWREGDDGNAVRLRIVDKARVFAAVFASMRGRTTIEVDDMQRAVALGQLLRKHTDRMGALGSGESFRLALRIERRLAQGGELGRRELYRFLRVDKATLEPVLETLVDRGEVIRVMADRGELYIHADHAESSDAYQASKPDATVIDITPGMSHRPRVTRKY